MSKALKITIEPRVFHFKQPAGTSRGVYQTRTSWLLTVSDGIHSGVGECAPLPDLSCDARPDDYESVLRRFCDDIERTGVVDYEALRDYPSMAFGLETALLHMQQGNRLFDTPFSRGEVGIPINGLVWMGTFEEMSQRIEQKLEQGFRCVKLKIGAIDFEAEMSLLKKIRQRFGPRDVELRVDANGAFPYGEALYKLELLSQYALHSIEQPIRQGQWGNMAELCRDAPLPIALDEELIGVNDPEQKRQLLQIVKPAYIVLKPSLHGGMQGCREWIDTARDLGVGSWITSALESNIGLHAIAQFCSAVYGPAIRMPQGLGTGQLFTDNIPMSLEIRGDQLWLKTD
jgi:o-succinylbenzoate synthase